MSDDSLDQLLARARRRDPAALAELLGLFGRRVFGLLLRLTGSQDLAEEMTQETFLRVVRTIDQYEHTGRFEAWLFRIAANIARDRGRSQSRRGPVVSLDDDLESADSGDGPMARCEVSPSGRLEQREAAEQLKLCLNRLSETDREIILLRHYSELSFKEIAELLGVPLGTALARAHRALAHLKAELGDECAA